MLLYVFYHLFYYLCLVIEEANWLTLPKDIGHLIGDGFDAVICLGNSFAHMPDTFGDQREQRYDPRSFEFLILFTNVS